MHILGEREIREKENMTSLGKILIILGVTLIIVGGIFTLGAKLPWFGRLPGDIYIQKKNFAFFFPITTSILISIILSLVMVLLKRR